jgi:hypothetical protein
MTRLLRLALLPAVILAASSVVDSSTARADEVRFGPYDVRTVFFIGKSDDRDEVHYGIRLDRDCRPIGANPIFPYWLQLERGPDEVDDLNFLDRTVYSVRTLNVDRGEGRDTSHVTFTLQATQDRLVTVEAKREGSQCVAAAKAVVAGSVAKLDRIFVKLARLWRVDYVDLFGTDPLSGRPIVERAKP